MAINTAIVINPCTQFLVNSKLVQADIPPLIHYHVLMPCVKSCFFLVYINLATNVFIGLAPSGRDDSVNHNILMAKYDDLTDFFV